MIQSVNDLYIIMRLYWFDPQNRWDNNFIMFNLNLLVDFSFFIWLFHESFRSNVSSRMRIFFEKCKCVVECDVGFLFLLLNIMHYVLEG